MTHAAAGGMAWLPWLDEAPAWPPRPGSAAVAPGGHPAPDHAGQCTLLLPGRGRRTIFLAARPGRTPGRRHGGTRRQPVPGGPAVARWSFEHPGL